MDTSKEYIKMSDKSPLRDLWIVKEGDWYFDKRFNRVSIVTNQDLTSENRGVFIEFKREFVPLYRQDQLQEMVLKGWSATEKIGRFNEWQLNTRDLPENITKYSMEQFWLAFVMKEKYGKIWNGNDWVKEERR